MSKQDIRLDLLQKLESNPEYTQRMLSKEMGVSLGKVNYCIRKLIEKGLLKLKIFRNHSNKVSYVYLLTPKGIEEKTKLTFTFLNIKIKEYEMLKDEIKTLQLEAEKINFLKHRVEKT
jgi:EPS-associated MarR family transcriptional regulator